MNLRKVTLDDIEILIQLRLAYLIADRGSLTADEEAAIRSQLTTYYPKHINHDFIAVLAEIDQQVVATGFLTITEKPANPAFITGKTGTFLNIFTYPEYRRTGLATKILYQLIHEARQLGVSSIELSATPARKPLYQKLGFTEPNPKYTPMKLHLT